MTDWMNLAYLLGTEEGGKELRSVLTDLGDSDRLLHQMGYVLWELREATMPWLRRVAPGNIVKRLDDILSSAVRQARRNEDSLASKDTYLGMLLRSLPDNLFYGHVGPLFIVDKDLSGRHVVTGRTPEEVLEKEEDSNDC